MNRQTEQAERIYRLAPCSGYELAEMEGWLEHMARQGYLLQKFVWYLAAVFVKGQPQNLRYRLTLLPNNTLAAQEKEAFIALHEEFGWQYGGQRGSFGIFYTADEKAIEPNTDPQLYAMALRQVQRQERISLLLLLLQAGLYIPFLLLKEGFFYTMLQFGSGVYAAAVLFAILCLYLVLSRYWSLRKLGKALIGQTGLTPNKDWRRNAACYQIKTAAVAALCSVSMLVAVIGGMLLTVQDHTIALEDYTEPFPFATMADLLPGSVFVPTDQSDYANYVKVRQDVLAPVQVSVSQRGKLYQNGSCVLEGDLLVDYYQTRWPWLAQQLARELQQRDERLWGKRYQRYEPLELPELDAAYAVAYRTLLPTVILADDCRVLYIMYNQSDGSEQISLEQLAQFYAEELKKEGGRL